MKILSVGNSFSVDSVEYLYEILRGLGEEDVQIGNCCIGGCTLDRHAENARGAHPAYELFTNCSGHWEIRPETALNEMLSAREWDVVTLQQQSGNSGNPASFGELDFLIGYIRSFQPKAKLMWNMTWAYPSQTDIGEDFDRYGRDRGEMYRKIVQTVKEVIVPRREFSRIIPTGTAIENARTSFVGDHLNRDGLHLSFGLGRYIASLTWAKILTEKPLAGIAFVPAGVSDAEKRVAIEAAENAYQTPYAVTQSAITEV